MEDHCSNLAAVRPVSQNRLVDSLTIHHALAGTALLELRSLGVACLPVLLPLGLLVRGCHPILLEVGEGRPERQRVRVGPDLRPRIVLGGRSGHRDHKQPDEHHDQRLLHLPVSSSGTRLARPYQNLMNDILRSPPIGVYEEDLPRTLVAADFSP